MMPRRFALAALLLVTAAPLLAAELPTVEKVELQPLAAQAKRIAEALDYLGTPLAAADRKALQEARDVAAIQAVLDRYCLAGVRIAAAKEGGWQLTAQAGAARPELAQQGWRVFLMKVDNPSGCKDLELRALSPSALPLYKGSSGSPEPKPAITPDDAKQRFLELQVYNTQPLLPQLAGLELEYRVLQVYCRDAGEKRASLSFSLNKADRKAPPVAASNAVEYAFTSHPAVPVKLAVHDEDGKPVTASFIFRDAQQRVYPSPSRRLAPDFGFQPQVYRADGESILLQPGKYTVSVTRGPEYLTTMKEIIVSPGASSTEAFALKRWLHPAARGWYSGDHHIHAAGCAHYENPTEGVTPEDMMRHILGEDLDVGCCLSWGPCWYHQKTFFEGRPNRLSTKDHILRYDVEVSGFPSSHCGHLCLLRLREQDYPGTKRIEDWPTWDLPILRWAKGQGGVVGFAHSGWGLDVGDTKELPNYVVPPMNGIGANEYVVDVVHGACDFISTVDTPAVWELNTWYHTLNCGYRCRISGETDFPCIYGERVGLGRSYVHLDSPLNFDAWAEGIRQGRCYVSDGKSHLLDFQVNGLGVGLKGSEVRLEKPGTVAIKARVAALLEANETAETRQVRRTPLSQRPYWDLERARIGATRTVPVEVVVNGRAVARKEVVADGTEQEVAFDVPIEQSSWVCLRILPSSHTNPIFVLVGDKPVRASKRSAQWCLDALEKCWKEKEPAIGKNKPADVHDRELREAKEAYDVARRAYGKILGECEKE